ncbi:MAG: hypothetical protein HQK75_19685 [Candidatus Magnetomorum sp.]|nr:hypothetical protein [Candidatus Magnetomorum sp.]
MKIKLFNQYVCIIIALIFFIHMPKSVDAYDFTDGLQKISPQQRGVPDGIDFLKNLRKILSTTQAEPEIEEFLTFWYESVQKFNFYQLYNSPYLKPLDNGYHAVTFQGYHELNHYEIALASAKGLQIPVRQLGDFRATFGLKQNKTCITGDRSYSGYIDSQTALQQFSHQTLAALLEGLITTIDPDNLNSLNDKECDRFSEIQGFSRKAINSFHKTYPRLLRMADQYLILHSAMDEKSHNYIPYTHFKLICEFDFKNMKKDYPNLYQQLKRLNSLFQFKISFQNKHGNHILDILLDSQDTFLYLDFYTHQGKVIPFTPEGEPVFEDAFHPTKVKDYELSLDMNIFFNIYGIKFRTDHIRVDGIYQRRKEYGSLTFKLKEVPYTQVKGRAYYIVPTWFIDIMIPGNIDQLIANFSKVMLTANKSEGSFMRLFWDTKEPRSVSFTPFLSGEFIDNFFILFGFQIWHEKFKMSDASAADLNQLIIRGTESLILDLSQIE